jgi:hypothetical protein
MENAAASLAGVAVSKLMSKKTKSAGPRMINTGASTYDTREGTFNLDPTIRQGQEDYISALGGFKTGTNMMFDKFNTGLTKQQEGIDSLRSGFEGNQSAYRDAMMNPLREQIDAQSGKLNRELNRTGVRGSFADQARSNLGITAGRALSDQEAIVENNRINKLGDFLNMDADILKQGLASDKGRQDMLVALEESLKGISQERFAQEMQMLGIPSQFAQANAINAQNANSSTGILGQAVSGLMGDVIGGFGDMISGSGSPTNNITAGADAYD